MIATFILVIPRRKKTLFLYFIFQSQRSYSLYEARPSVFWLVRPSDYNASTLQPAMVQPAAVYQALVYLLFDFSR